MENRIAIIGIFVENNEVAGEINNILHEYHPYIIGRMGLPYKQRNIGVISIIVDAPNRIISALSGKIGMLEGVYCKALYSKEQVSKMNEFMNEKHKKDCEVS